MNGLNNSIYSDELQHPALPSNIIDDTELVALALASQDGLVKEDGYAKNRVEIPVGMVVTNRRVVFAAVDSDGSDAGDIAYNEIASIDKDGRTVVLTSLDGVEWRFPVANPDSRPVDIALRHLLWIGEVRNRLVSMSNDIELEVGQIEAMREELNWTGAMDKYRAMRAELDDLISTVYFTDVLADEVLAPELTELERTLETAGARVYIERAHSQLELAKQIIEYDNFDQAMSVFKDVDQNYKRAHGHCEEVIREDAFQFGEQRELAHELDKLKWEIESAAAEPLQQANEAKVEAQTADDLESKIEHWEDALRQYRGVLTLEWDDTQEFTGDQESTKTELRHATERLIKLYEHTARKRWNDGSELESGGDVSAALETCSVALEHLERAHELAEEYDPELATDFKSRLKNMFELYLDMLEQADSGVAEMVEHVPDAIESVELDTPDRSQTDNENRESTEGPTEGELSESPDANNEEFTGSQEPKGGELSEKSEADEEEFTGSQEANEGELSGIPETGERPDNAIPSLDDLTEMDTHHEITLDLGDTESATSSDVSSANETDSETAETDEDRSGEIETESSETQA